MRDVQESRNSKREFSHSLSTRDFLIEGLLKVHMKRIFFISLFERAFKMMKNGVHFIRIALLVAELFKILIYAN